MTLILWAIFGYAAGILTALYFPARWTKIVKETREELEKLQQK